MTVEKPLSQGEVIALIAALFATIAISIDAMLPAMPEIAATLSPDAPNRAQLVVTSFVFGMGLGTLIAGPLSDAFGRKIIILLGSALYVVAAIACYFAKTLDFLLIARVVQGFGAAAPRVVSTAMVRDLFSGREMARVMSFVMMVFTLVPAVAPLMGQAVIYAAGWHAIFLVYVVFSIIILLWMGLRQPETLAVAARRPLSVAALWAATKEVFSSRVVLVSIIAQSLTLAALFAMMGLSMGNLNALAMEPVGHIAGFASSVIGAIATVVSVVLAVPVGLAFDGTARPLMAGVLVFISMALLSMRFAGPARR